MSFDAFLLGNDPAIRLAFFLGMFGLMAAWELFAPRRVLGVSKPIRWTHNISIAIINVLLVRVSFPSAAVGVAVFAEERGTGLLNMFAIPYPLAFLASLLALDLAMYLVHLMFHAVPALWRVHRMHHADVDFDVTTGARFHPIQILLALPIKFAVIFALGLPVVAVLVFEAVFNALSLFNHANVRIPPTVDRLLRWFLVTPDMHRVHHSVDATETNSNFSFVLPWWDRLFGTYCAQPKGGHERMAIGVDQFRTPRDFRLDRMLLQPFRDDAGPYAINRRWKTG
jgi:sterol desaturase/sphingolipid hydroxylase (fatty acid hydroxylase superfamily)